MRVVVRRIRWCRALDSRHSVDRKRRIRIQVYTPVYVRLYARSTYRERENGEESERDSLYPAKRAGCENTIACTGHTRAVNALNITLQIMRIYSTLAPCFSLSFSLSSLLPLSLLPPAPASLSPASLILPNYKNCIWPYYCKVNSYNELCFENVTRSSRRIYENFNLARKKFTSRKTRGGTLS